MMSNIKDRLLQESPILDKTHGYDWAQGKCSICSSKVKVQTTKSMQSGKEIEMCYVCYHSHIPSLDPHEPSNKTLTRIIGQVTNMVIEEIHALGRALGG